MRARTLAVLLPLAALAVACGDAGVPLDGPDAAADAGTGDDDGPGDGELRMGAHPLSVHALESFTEVEDGDTVGTELGAQGLTMVVLAAKTKGLFTGRVSVDLELSVGDLSLGQLSVSDRRPTEGPDGWDYVFDLFVIVDSLAVHGEQTMIRMTVTDEHGTSAEVVRQVLVATTATKPCPGTLPVTSAAGDFCRDADAAAIELDGAAADGVSVTPFGKLGALVASRRASEVTLWEIDGKENPGLLDSWTTSGAPTHGPWALRIGFATAAVVWGQDDGVWYASPGNEPVLAIAAVAPVRAFGADEGCRVLVRGNDADVVWLQEDGSELKRHLVQNGDEIAELTAGDTEDTIFVLWTSPDPGAPLWVQQSPKSGGSQTVPAELGHTLGDDAVIDAAAVGYGLPVLAYTRAATLKCPPERRIAVRNAFGGGFDATPTVPSVGEVRALGFDSVAVVVGLAPDEAATGWVVTGQFLDVALQSLSVGAFGLERPDAGDPPEVWDVARTATRFALAWSTDAGVRYQAFCFREPGLDDDPDAPFGAGR